MNREIKFRAWSIKDKGWIAGFNMVNFHSYYNKGLEPSVYRYGSSWKLSEIELMQFTGLKDKNGKEIWEGDILDMGHDVPALVLVYFRDGGFWYMFPDKSTDIPFAGHSHLESILTRFNVIGNIHEHPHLLTP